MNNSQKTLHKPIKTKVIIMRFVLAICTVAVVLGLMFHVNLDEYFNAVAWIKAIHVIAIICWMAGMLYLPRLFIYHCRAEIGSVQSQTFKIMERRLLKAIILPAMVVSWITGLWLAWTVYQFHGGWLHAKLAFVLVLSGFHGVLSRGVRHFAEDKNNFSEKTWRILNEVPTVLMILIVILVIVQPF